MATGLLVQQQQKGVVDAVKWAAGAHKNTTHSTTAVGEAHSGKGTVVEGRGISTVGGHRGVWGTP